MEDKIIVDDKNVRRIVRAEINRLGNKAELNHIDVSQVTDMYGVFEYSDFNGDVSKWDVGNVVDMGWMFYNSPFNQDISNWDVSNVEYMNSMFQGSPFNQDISKWDVSKVDYMCHMFENSSFDKNIDMWNYNFKAVEENPGYFILNTKGSYTLIEKYVNALKSKKFDLAEEIKFKMKATIKNRRNEHDNTN